jgi:hypothetical protein
VRGFKLARAADAAQLVWCVTHAFNYFRVFRRHAALFVFAMALLCPSAPARNKLRAFKPTRGMPRKPPAFTLLTSCLTPKSIGNTVQPIHDTPH